MSIWLRGGPFSISSRGRVGVRLGPVGIYGGGRRRRRSNNGDGSGGCLPVLGVLVVLALIALVVKYWYISVPVLALGVVCFIGWARYSRSSEPMMSTAEAKRVLDSYMASLSPLEQTESQMKIGRFEESADPSAPNRALVAHARTTQNPRLEQALKTIWVASCSSALEKDQAFPSVRARQLAEKGWEDRYSDLPGSVDAPEKTSAAAQLKSAER